jgi:RpiB/LacA/LacB family sugar-phosphate isomerase
MKIAIACDHGGFALKEVVISAVHEQGDTPIDLGTFSLESVDYPDYAGKLTEEILSGRAERGVLICGSGVGACIAANKFNGIYAGMCHDTYSAHQGVEHDNMNVLCLGARIIGSELAREVVKAFLSAGFLNEPRFQRRFKKVQAIEQRK